MNKKLKMFLATGLIAVSTLTLVACNDDSDKAAKQSTQSEQQTDAQEDTKKDEKKTEDKKTDSNAKKENSNKKDDKKENTSNNKKSITYYTYNSENEKLTEHTKAADDISVANVIDALVDEGILQEGTKVNKAKVEEVDGVRTLVVDVNDKFVNFDQGSTQEMLQLKSFADSLIKTFKVKQVLLTVEGKPYSGGHMAFNEGEMLNVQ